MDPVVRVKGFLSEPLDTFDASREDTLEEAVKYYITLAAIYSVLSAVMSAFLYKIFGPKIGFGMLWLFFDADSGIDIAIQSFIISLILILIWGAVLHIFVYILSRKKDVKPTIKAAMYGSTSGLLFGWIPILGVIGFIWSSVLMIIGIRQFQELTTGRAILTVLMPTIIFSILVIAIVAAIAQFVGMV